MSQGTVAELLVGLSLDSSSFDNSIAQVNRSTTTMEKAFKTAQTTLKGSEKGISDYNNAIKAGNGVIEQYKTKLTTLNQAYDKQKQNLEKLVARQKELPDIIAKEKSKRDELAKTLGKSSEEYKKSAESIKKLEQEQSGMDKTISNTVNAMRKQETAIEETNNKMKSAEKTVGGYKNEITKLNSTSLNKLSNEFKKVSDSMQKMGDKISSVGSKISGFGKGMTIGVTAPILGIVGASAKARLSLDQMTRKSKIVFGDMQKDVASWALENEEAFGLGAGTIEGYTATIADLTQGLGMGKKASFDMAKGATELGVKLANWAGVMPDAAIDDVTKALAGSHKAMDKYGVKLNDNVLNEYARKRGLEGTFSSLTEAEKAQVRYDAILGSSENAVKSWDDGNRSASFHLNKMKEMITNVFEVLGTNLGPTIEKITEKVGEMAKKFSDWAAENPELLNQLIDIALKIALIGPAIMIVGGIIAGLGSIISGVGKLAGGIGKIGSKAFGMLGKSAATSAGEVAKVGGKFSGLSSLMSNPYVLIAAFVALIAKIGDSESSLLAIQEKFGALGFIFSGICEFISGAWQLTISNVVSFAQFLVEAVAAIFSGDTISAAWERNTGRVQKNCEEAGQKMLLTSTRGMDNLLRMTDEKLLTLNTTYKTAMGQIPLITEGKVGEAAYKMANTMNQMDSDTLTTLTGMNDHTKMMFEGINHSMTVDERAGRIRANLEQMSAAGHLEGDDFKNALSSAMETVNSKMDVKPATDKVEGDLANMANVGGAEAQKLATNVATEAGKLPGAVKEGTSQVPGIVKDAMDNANNVNSNGYTEMQQNTINQLGNMLNDIRGKFDEMIKAMVSIVNGGVSNVDAAFMKVFNAVKNIMVNLKIEVTNQMKSIRDEMSKPITLNVKRNLTTQSITIPSPEPQLLDMSAYDVNSNARYSNSGSVSQSFKQADSSSDNIVGALINQSKLLMEQNKLLNSLLSKQSDVYVDNNITLDGRVVAKQTAPYMKSELATIDKRSSRLGGNF